MRAKLSLLHSSFITHHSAFIIYQTPMPTYEYKCDACGHAFEKFQPITSDPVKKCPVCGKNKVRRLISAGGGLIFKGSGFYITDYRDKGYGEQAKADSANTTDKPAESKSIEAGSDTPKAAPAESKPAESQTEKTTPKESAPKSETKSEPKASKSAKKK
jgi:putative FmdB family regulatory protein